MWFNVLVAHSSLKLFSSSCCMHTEDLLVSEKNFSGLEVEFLKTPSKWGSGRVSPLIWEREGRVFAFEFN